MIASVQSGLAGISLDLGVGTERFLSLSAADQTTLRDYLSTPKMTFSDPKLVKEPIDEAVKGALGKIVIKKERSKPPDIIVLTKRLG